MQIESHVVSLETAKRMKDLGWPQGYDNAYVWDKGELRVVRENYDVYMLDGDCIAAPLLSEILEALPTYHPKDDTYFFVLSKNSGWTVEYASKEGQCLVYCENSNPVEAAALLWIKLVEEGIISSHEKE